MQWISYINFNITFTSRLELKLNLILVGFMHIFPCIVQSCFSNKFWFFLTNEWCQTCASDFFLSLIMSNRWYDFSGSGSVQTNKTALWKWADISTPHFHLVNFNCTVCFVLQQEAVRGVLVIHISWTFIIWREIERKLPVRHWVC